MYHQNKQRASQQLSSPQVMKDYKTSVKSLKEDRDQNNQTEKKQLGGNRDYRAWRKLKQT